MAEISLTKLFSGDFHWTVMSSGNVWTNTETVICSPLQWRHIERDGVSNLLRIDYLLNRLFRHIKKILKFSVTGLCEGNPPVTGEFPAQRASKNVSIWWRHHNMASLGHRVLNNPIHTMYIVNNRFRILCWASSRMEVKKIVNFI